jgi:hypothetical protein
MPDPTLPSRRPAEDFYAELVRIRSLPLKTPWTIPSKGWARVERTEVLLDLALATISDLAERIRELEARAT